MFRIICRILMVVLLSLPHLSGAADLVLDENACGSRQNLVVGDFLEVRLPGNPTTGYLWETVALSSLLRQQGDAAHRSESQRTGAGGITSFRFISTTAGDGILDLAWRRPWESDKPPLRTCTIQLKSVTAPHIQPSGVKVGLDKHGNAIYQVSANGIKIGYKLSGSGEPLVMIMGLGGTMDLWPQKIIEALSQKYQLILLDNRGMGQTTGNDVPFTYKLFADDVIGLLDALGVKKTHVLGYSMGSTITQKLLMEYPQRFNKAIIHATSTDGSNVVEALKGHTVGVPPTVLRQLEATIHWKTPLDKLPLITNQVLLIVGTSDATVGIESSITMASAIPGAWLVQFKKGTHHLMYEAPAEFARIVETFLAINETVPVK
jgi:pimeloyl-ACP methyl ester carboxylesterase/predicted secreted protein